MVNFSVSKLPGVFPVTYLASAPTIILQLPNESNFNTFQIFQWCFEDALTSGTFPGESTLTLPGIANPSLTRVPSGGSAMAISATILTWKPHVEVLQVGKSKAAERLWS